MAGRARKINRQSGGVLEFDIRLQAKQMLLLEAVESGIRYPFYGGAKGGGKSYASRMIMLAMLMKYPGTTGLLIRRTFKQLAGNHIRPLFMQFPEMRDWYNKTDGVLSLPNGSELLFGHSEHEDDIFAYQGQEYDFIGVEEVTQFTEFQWEMLTTSSRTSKMDVNPVMWATGNPGGVGHAWVKRVWIDRRFEEFEEANEYTFIPATVFDNKILLTADPKYIKILQSMKNEELKRAYLHGDWDIYPGQYFSQWNRSDIEVKSFEIPQDWPLFGSVDYGESSPTSFGLYTVDYDGIVIRLFEYYRAGLSASQHAEEIKLLIEGFVYTEGRWPDLVYADPSMWVKRRVDEEAVNDTASGMFAEKGVHLTRANNDRINGWRICKDALVHDRFKAFESWNDNLFRTIPALPRDDRKPEDVDTHAEDHVADEWRYLMVHCYKPVYEEDEFDTRGRMAEVIKELTKPDRRKSRYTRA